MSTHTHTPPPVTNPTPPHQNKNTSYNITAQPAPDLARLLPSFRPEELGMWMVGRAGFCVFSFFICHVGINVGMYACICTSNVPPFPNPPTHPHKQQTPKPDLLSALLKLNPNERALASEALDHPYFRTEPRAIPPMQLPLPLEGREGGSGNGDGNDGWGMGGSQ